MVGPGFLIRPRVRTHYSVDGVPHPAGLSRQYREAIAAQNETLASDEKEFSTTPVAAKGEEEVLAGVSAAASTSPKVSETSPSSALPQLLSSTKTGAVLPHPILSTEDLKNDLKPTSRIVAPVAAAETARNRLTKPEEGKQTMHEEKSSEPLPAQNLSWIEGQANVSEECARLCSRVEHLNQWLSEDPLLMCAEQVRSERRLRGHENDEMFRSLCYMLLGVDTIPLIPPEKLQDGTNQESTTSSNGLVGPTIAAEGFGRAGPVRPVVVPIGNTFQEPGSLRSLAARGVPTRCRPAVWRLLCDYLPPSSSAAPSVHLRKWKEYREYVSLYFSFVGDAVQQGHAVLISDGYAAQVNGPINARAAATANTAATGAGASARAPLRAPPSAEANKREMRLGSSGVVCVAYSRNKSRIRSRMSSTISPADATPPSFYLVDLERVQSLSSPEKAILAQLALDLPRHRTALFHVPATVAALTRCLFLWSLRRPAVGYVQGIDDVMAVFFLAFLGEAIRVHEVLSMERNMSELRDKVCDLDKYVSQQKGMAAAMSNKAVAQVYNASAIVKRWRSFLPSFSTDAANTKSRGGVDPTGFGGHDVQEFLRRVWCYQPLPAYEHRSPAVTHTAAETTGLSEALAGGSGTEMSIMSRSLSRLSVTDRENSLSLTSPPMSTTATPTSRSGPPPLSSSAATGDARQEAGLPRIPRSSNHVERGAFTIIGREAEDDLTSNDIEDFRRRIDKLPQSLLEEVEADTYWCGGQFLSWIQDNYYHGQSGIMEMLAQLDAVLRTAEPELTAYFDGEGIMIRDCCFQWMHCLLARELPQHLVMLLWDTYLAIGREFRVFHVYVCAALVSSLRNELMGRPIDVILAILKSPLNPPVPAAPVRTANTARSSLMGSAAAKMTALMYGSTAAKGSAQRPSSSIPGAARTGYRRKDKVWLDGIIKAAFEMWKPSTA